MTYSSYLSELPMLTLLDYNSLINPTVVYEFVHPNKGSSWKRKILHDDSFKVRHFFHLKEDIYSQKTLPRHNILSKSGLKLGAKTFSDTIIKPKY